ncbi:hypothetical protein Mth01_25130 [Sphaerimonospora thailandensis]|uniref:Uncharacterized protein n=1 Tax=Sphaerimonospora thailandensis TaxID=795644 RepID=A0A8J3R998_9ACTN|nr:hypothetical protein Mth01_25130 [Sphaerimonospora thailandensis]
MERRPLHVLPGYQACTFDLPDRVKPVSARLPRLVARGYPVGRTRTRESVIPFYVRFLELESPRTKTINEVIGLPELSVLFP